jgi:hypothetical protein
MDIFVIKPPQTNGTRSVPATNSKRLRELKISAQRQSSGRDSKSETAESDAMIGSRLGEILKRPDCKKYIRIPILMIDESGRGRLEKFLSAVRNARRNGLGRRCNGGPLHIARAAGAVLACAFITSRGTAAAASRAHGGRLRGLAFTAATAMALPGFCPARQFAFRAVLVFLPARARSRKAVVRQSRQQPTKPRTEQ